LPLAPEPTATKVGSVARLRVYSARRAAGQAIFHPDDVNGESAWVQSDYADRNNRDKDYMEWVREQEAAAVIYRQQVMDLCRLEPQERRRRKLEQQRLKRVNMREALLAAFAAAVANRQVLPSGESSRTAS
jgi:hypothetical protein